MTNLPFAFLPSLGPIELIILGMIASTLIVTIWAMIDAIGRPDKQWTGLNINKALWVILLILMPFVCAPIGLVISIYYLAVMRPKLDAVGGPSF